MGIWSRLAGEIFLDWLALPPGLRCIDIGCGNGAFTELLIERCAPAEVQGIDPSAGAARLCAHAAQRAGLAQFQQGDAMALPFAENSFDAAFMALVIFFVPEPAKGVAEMARVVRPGGTVAAYAWDMLGGGFSDGAVSIARSRALGHKTLWAPPRAEAVEHASPARAMERRRSRAKSRHARSRCSGRFADFDEFWTTTTWSGSSVEPIVIRDSLQATVRTGRDGGCARSFRPMPPAASATARVANAIKGRVPKSPTALG